MEKNATPPPPPSRPLCLFTYLPLPSLTYANPCHHTSLSHLVADETYHSEDIGPDIWSQFRIKYNWQLPHKNGNQDQCQKAKKKRTSTVVVKKEQAQDYDLVTSTTGELNHPWLERGGN